MRLATRKARHFAREMVTLRRADDNLVPHGCVILYIQRKLKTSVGLKHTAWILNVTLIGIEGQLLPEGENLPGL